MKRIPLSARRGIRRFALVDDGDYDQLVALGPWAMNENRQTSYAFRADVGSMHRLLLGLQRGDSRQADHIDGNGLNNQRSNLRIVSSAENRQNLRKRAGTSSRFRGVCWHKRAQKWEAKVHHGGRMYHAGLFSDELDAGIAAQALRDEHMPFAQPDPALVAALELRKAVAA